LKGWHYNNHFNKILFIGVIIWILNAGFTILASPAALRFQSFPLTLTTISVALLVDWMIKLMKQLSKQNITSIYIKQEVSDGLTPKHVS
jgi:hypothetical protein